MKTKSISRLNMEDGLICALSCIEPRIPLLSNKKRAQTTTVARKFSIGELCGSAGGLGVCAGGLDILKID